MREVLEAKFVTERIPNWLLLREMAYEMPSRPEKRALFDAIRHSVLYKLACYLGSIPLEERMVALAAMLEELQAAGIMHGSTPASVARRMPVLTRRHRSKV